MNMPPPEPVGRLWLLPLLLTCVAASLFAAFWFALKPTIEQGPGAGPVSTPLERFSRETSLKLIELRNQAMGDLENREFGPAESAFSEILHSLPTEPFATRNLAICRQLALDATDKQQFPQKFAELAVATKEAIDVSKSVEPSSFVPWVISARAATKLEQTETALNDLREAARLSPDSVGPSYDLFVLLQSAPGDKQSDEGFAALQKVAQRESQNLFVLKDWLPLLAQRQSPQLVDALEQAQTTIAPFVEMIKVHTRIDLRQTIDAALVDATEGKWPKVQRSMTILKNLIVSESARDKRFVMLDSLEYLLFDFTQGTLARFDLPSSQSPPTRPAKFLAPDDVANWPQFADFADVAVTDFDLDGRPDLVILDNKQLVAWGRKVNDQAWTMQASADAGDGYTGLLAFDFDDDVDQTIKGIRGPDNADDTRTRGKTLESTCHAADSDAILYGPAGLKLFENSRDEKSNHRTLTAKTGGTEFDEVSEVVTATVADLDADGDLDLVASTSTGLRIFSNRGNLTFEETTARSLLPASSTEITAMAIVDWDKDSDIDILVATSEGAGLLENVRHGQLRYRRLEDFSVLRAATTLSLGDFDGDTSWDIAAAGPSGGHVAMTNRTSAGVVGVRKSLTVTQLPVRSAMTGDFDNDGLLDLIILDGTGAMIFRFDEQQIRFAPTQGIANDWLKNVARLSVDDLDRDGDLDLVVADAGHVVGHLNQCCEADLPHCGFLEMQLVGERIRPGEQNWDKRVNHINLGGTLEVKVGNRYQARIVTGQITHFGLGSNRQADLARILWTNGIPSNLMHPTAHESICIEQKLVGSCPYLYAWNGERFEFVTDLLWNAPLGLKFAETVVAPWREWEYLKIDGRQLKVTDNEYQLRITSELWEADYFDQVKLFAIDHPEGTDIFTNEKVGPASIAEPKIHTVQTVRSPVAARDTKGRDVLDQVIARDGNYAKTFEKRIAQGLTEQHFLELDLGRDFGEKTVTTDQREDHQESTIQIPGHAVLFLTGWMYPGSTSLSVQFSQNPELQKPKPPALFAPDINGEWREVQPFMGFPGGKTKTIAIDLSGVFVNGDHRLRIVSTMEIFWDCVFFTVDDAPIDFRQSELTLVRAELRDRGGVSSRSWPVAGNGPDQFDYASLVPGEAWPAMSGCFTRYGNVLPLLATRDDQLAVIGSGDEIQLAFAEPIAPLPQGWVRDFVIYSVGWDKDADPNTVYGNTVEPLPFQAMTDYAHQNGDSRPLDPDYCNYLREYQTRTRNPSKFWKRLHQTSGNER